MAGGDSIKISCSEPRRGKFDEELRRYSSTLEFLRGTIGVVRVVEAVENGFENDCVTTAVEGDGRKEFLRGDGGGEGLENARGKS